MKLLQAENPLLVLGGPTGSGKSAIALELCEWLSREHGVRAEILCADSITIYKGFDIGAAKPGLEDRKRIPHHLLDLKEANEDFSAADFTQAALPAIAGLHEKKILPVLVGGSGFYLRALIQGMTEESEEESRKSSLVKEELEVRADREGVEKLYREVLAKDPALSGKIHPNDRYRVIRALQAMLSTGRKWSELNEAARNAPPRFPNHRYFVLNLPKEELKKRLESRARAMLKAGLVEEVRALLAKGVSDAAKPMQSVGYKEVLEFLRGTIRDEESLAAAIVSASLKLAKSQNTWFKGEKLPTVFVEDFAGIKKSLLLG